MEQKENRPVDVSQFIMFTHMELCVNPPGHKSPDTTVGWYWHVDPVQLHRRLVLPWRLPHSA